MKSQTCTARAKSGRMCKSKTKKGQYCWVHLKQIEGLRIMLSRIPGAGLGLFAFRDFAAGENVARYTGDLVPSVNDGEGGAYYLELSEEKSIDAARTNAGEGRWCNDPRMSGNRANVRFVSFPAGPRARLEATRPIKKGTEILVSYGPAYWNYYTRRAKAAGLGPLPVATPAEMAAARARQSIEEREARIDIRQVKLAKQAKQAQRKRIRQAQRKQAAAALRKQAAREPDP